MFLFVHSSNVFSATIASKLTQTSSPQYDQSHHQSQPLPQPPSQPYYGGVSEGGMEAMMGGNGYTNSTPTSTSHHPMESLHSTSQHKTAVIDLVRIQAKANAAKVTSTKAVRVADEYRHHAIRRAKEKNKAWVAAAKLACDEATC